MGEVLGRLKGFKDDPNCPGLLQCYLNCAASRHNSTLGRSDRWYRRVWATRRGASLSLMACFRAATWCSWSAISLSVCTGWWVSLGPAQV